MVGKSFRSFEFEDIGEMGAAQRTCGELKVGIRGPS